MHPRSLALSLWCLSLSLFPPPPTPSTHMHDAERVAAGLQAVPPGEAFSNSKKMHAPPPLRPPTPPTLTKKNLYFQESICFSFRLGKARMSLVIPGPRELKSWSPRRCGGDQKMLLFFFFFGTTPPPPFRDVVRASRDSLGPRLCGRVSQVREWESHIERERELGHRKHLTFIREFTKALMSSKRQLGVSEVQVCVCVCVCVCVWCVCVVGVCGGGVHRGLCRDTNLPPSRQRSQLWKPKVSELNFYFPDVFVLEGTGRRVTR